MFRLRLRVKGAPAREGSKIFNKDGDEVGVVTSGTFAPSLSRPISMGYVKKGFGKADTQLVVEVRGRKSDCVVEKLPFVPLKYYKP